MCPAHTNQSTNTLLFRFFIISLLLTLPFICIGYFIDLTHIIRVDLPFSALTFICPALTLLILKDRESGRPLLFSVLSGLDFFQVDAFDRKNFKLTLFALLIVPAVLMLHYYLLRIIDNSTPVFSWDVRSFFVFLILFFCSAFVEELGWTAYLMGGVYGNDLRLSDGILMGVLWSLIHLVPYLQTSRTCAWVLFQCLLTILYRVLMLWLYEKSNRNFRIVVILHCSINTATFLFPIYGSHYNPLLVLIILLPTTILLFYRWPLIRL